MLAAEIPSESIETIDKIYNSVVDLTKPGGSDYFSYVVDLANNPTALRVKLADMMQNIGDNPSPRQIAKYSKAKDILVDKFKDSPPPSISDKQWQDFKDSINKASKSIN